MTNTSVAQESNTWYDSHAAADDDDCHNKEQQQQQPGPESEPATEEPAAAGTAPQSEDDWEVAAPVWRPPIEMWPLTKRLVP